MRRLAVMLVFSCIAGLVPANADEQASFSAVQQNGFGRLIVTFADRDIIPEYDVIIADGVLKINFNTPVNVDLGNAPALLPAYISVARRNGDGRSIRFALRDDFTVNSIEAADQLYVDLLPASWAGPPPKLPEDIIKKLAERAAEALRKARRLEQERLRSLDRPKVALRVGRHRNFSRLTFDWNVSYDSAFTRENDLVRIRFNHPVALDLTRLKLDMPQGIVDAASAIDEDQLKFLMRVEQGADIRAFRDGQSYVIDITPTGIADDKVNAAIRRKTDPAGPIIGSDAITTRGTLSQNSAVNDRKDELAAKPESDLPAQQNTSSAKPQMASQAETIVDNTLQAEKPIALPPILPLTASSARPTSMAQPQIISQAARQPANEEIKNPESVLSLSNDPAKQLVQAEARRIGNAVRVVFPFQQPVASAVFIRQGAIWLVFDTITLIDINGLRSTLGRDAENVVIQSHDGWQSLRIEPTQNALATIGVDGNSWILTIGDMILEPTKPMTIMRRLKADGTSALHLPFEEAAMTHRLRDPVIGDDITVVTGFGPARGIVQSHDLVDLTVLKSAHGVAILPRTDDITIERLPANLMIERPGGLHLTGVSDRAGWNMLGQADAKDGAQNTSVAPEIIQNPAIFRKKLRKLQRELDNAEQAEAQTSMRAKLANFLVDNGLGLEALGILTLMVNIDPTLANEGNYNLLMAAASQIAGRARDARESLNRINGDAIPEMAVWDLISSAQLGDWPRARASIDRGHKLVENFAEPIQNEFWLSAIRTMIELNDFGEAMPLLARIDQQTLSHEHAARLDILRARIADASGRSREAVNAFKSALRSNIDEQWAEAKYRMLRIQVRDEEISTDEAIDALANLAITWRGDEIEMKTLRFLAQLHIQKNAYREAFDVAKIAMQANSDSATTRLLQQEVADVFSDLFLKGKATQFSPVEAMALYYDYRELTPIGTAGDEIVRQLAYRLIAVDLLQEAATLLSHQVENRLKGVARSQIAAHLAAVHLMNRNAAEALRVLNRTRQAILPAMVERQRNLIEAWALSTTGRPELAMTLVRNFHGRDVDKLLADTLWKAQNWGAAGAKLEMLLGDRWRDKLPLDEDERSDVLKATLSYAMENNRLALDRIQNKFAEKMENSPDAQAFRSSTKAIKLENSQFLSALARVSKSDPLGQFLEEYRQNYLLPSSETGINLVGNQASRTPKIPPVPATVS